MSIADLSREEQEKAEKLCAFFAGGMHEPVWSDQCSREDDWDHQRFIARNEALLDELDSWGKGEAQEPAIQPVDAGEETCEKVYDEPAQTAYDRARQKVLVAEALLDASEQGSDEWHEAMAALAAAKQRFKTEQDRATDPTYRKRRATDEWRSGEGKPEYNASRRKVRSKPNVMTPKHVLEAMTPEEFAQHKLDKNAEKQWRYARRKAGWSEQKIEEKLPGWWAKRLVKRSCD
ncbi:hypothetical protein [Phaeobacter inhibens]|uniref:hypothetical protein n=1 Tax=Phaeobacter inhibens TaxID=221822 RepID=UPI0021A77877|nr:hypothetical protein [Phaeobacter inhibens]UWR59105.1 hypothetical protein K4F88_09085 [Phaeobacter inhibens]